MIKKIIKRNLGLMWLCMLIFLSGIPFGYIYYYDYEDLLMPSLERLKDIINEESRFETAINIFVNNFMVTLILIVMGSLIVPTLIVMFVNGFLVGFIAKMLANERLGLDFFIKGVAPHGILELAAVFIAAAVGMRIGLSYLTLNNRDRAWKVSRSIKDAVYAEYFIVAPMLLLAAFIEAYISAALIG